MADPSSSCVGDEILVDLNATLLAESDDSTDDCDDVLWRFVDGGTNWRFGVVIAVIADHQASAGI